jgi:hypothetical protein
MKFRTVLLSGLVAGVLVGTVPVLASAQPARASQGRFDSAAVNRSFQSVLHRAPRPYELRRYVSLMNDYGWTEQQVRRDLAERSDYRRYSSDSSLDVDAIVTRAHEDILGRRPDAASMRSQRTRMTQQGWTERDVREDLRQSAEYQSNAARIASADRIITRVFQDVLKRDPKPAGLVTYRRAIIEDGWDEQDLRKEVQNSDEARGLQGGGTTAPAQAAASGGRQGSGGQQKRGTGTRGKK